METRRIHTLPVGDIEVHAAQASCWCYPTETSPGVWVHNAKDCREAIERATGEKSSDGWICIAEFPLDQLAIENARMKAALKFISQCENLKDARNAALQAGVCAGVESAAQRQDKPQ